jgi:hypothetical protein
MDLSNIHRLCNRRITGPQTSFAILLLIRGLKAKKAKTAEAAQNTAAM